MRKYTVLKDLPNSGNIQEIQVNYKKRPSSELRIIKDSKDIYNILKEVWSDRMDYVEEAVLLALNRRNEVLGWVKLSSGGSYGTVMDIKMIFQINLNINASAFVLAHNHPSGNLLPSDQDIQLFRRAKEAGNLLDCPLLDNIIMTSDGYYSFTDEGKR